MDYIYVDDRNVTTELARIATALERIAAALAVTEGPHALGVPLKGLPDLRVPRPPDGE
jgi:hypothetical protein